MLRENRRAYAIILSTSPGAEFGIILPEQARASDNEALLEAIRRGTRNENVQITDQQSLIQARNKTDTTCGKHQKWSHTSSAKSKNKRLHKLKL